MSTISSNFTDISFFKNIMNGIRYYACYGSVIAGCISMLKLYPERAKELRVTIQLQAGFQMMIKKFGLTLLPLIIDIDAMSKCHCCHQFMLLRE